MRLKTAALGVLIWQAGMVRLWEAGDPIRPSNTRFLIVRLKEDRVCSSRAWLFKLCQSLPSVA